MRILITGSNGMLGSDLVNALSDYELSGIGLHSNRHSQISYLQTDITNRTALFKAFEWAKPAIVIHTAAYTDVDGCELNPHQAFLVNTKATEYIADASNNKGTVVFFISSDYVFDGSKKTPYEETDRPNPISVYGKSKFEAEEVLKSKSNSVIIIRSSWLFGMNGRNFFKSIVDQFSKNQPLKVVDDQKGAPTYTKDLAGGIKQLIQKNCRVRGFELYHLANQGETTWFGAAKRLAEKIRKKISIVPTSPTELGRPAKRPSNSVLDMSKIKNADHIELRNWKDAFDDFLEHELRPIK